MKNRIDRLSQILLLLHQGNKLSTPYLSKKFNVSSKVIQTDFKDYLIPLFDNQIIYYSYESKSYQSKSNFLTKTYFNAEDLAVIAILKSKSKDKYSDEDLYEKVNAMFHNYEDALSNSIYTRSDIEKIDKFKTEIIQIHHAIDYNTPRKQYKKNHSLIPKELRYTDYFKG